MQEQLDALRIDYHDFNACVIPVLPYPATVQFCKQVSKGRPCVYELSSTTSTSWPALSWTERTLLNRVKEPVDVAVTPSGNADSLIPYPKSTENLLFVEPATILLSLKQLMSKLSSAPGARSNEMWETAYYLQSQNSNLTSTPLSPLLEDLQPNFDFAEEVLGEPDARNIWIGDERSVTSIHRDPYENLYLVLRGQKTFRLWAPVDEVLMPTIMVSTGRYSYDESNDQPNFNVETDEGGEQISWVTLDPLCDRGSREAALHTDLLEKVHQVTVKEGQILYLPSGWYHHVTQQCGTWDDGSPAPCIAVNYWYDMDYEGERYVSRQFVSRMVDAVRNPSERLAHNKV
jgi:peptidyl-lysine (3S)-dioxygenase / protease